MKYSVILSRGDQSTKIATGLSLADAYLLISIRNGSTDRTFSEYAGGTAYIVEDGTAQKYWYCPILKATNWMYVVYETDDECEIKDNTTKYYSSFEKAYLAIRKYLDGEKYNIQGSSAAAAADYPDLFGYSLTGLFVSLCCSDMLSFVIDEKTQANPEQNPIFFLQRPRLHTCIRVVRQELL